MKTDRKEKRKSSIKEKWQHFVAVMKGGAETPEQVARAAGLGAFLGYLPLFGIGILFVYPAARLLRVSPAVAFAANIVLSNPLTMAPAWALQLGTGFLLFGLPLPTDWSVAALKPLLKPYFLVYLTGGTVFGIVFSLFVYGIIYVAVRVLRRGGTKPA